MTVLPESPRGLAEFLAAHTAALTESLDNALVASFVHGSVAMDSFVPYRSDLDVIAVVNGPLTIATKSVLVRRIWALPTPEEVRGVETRIVTHDEIRDTNKMSRTELLVSTHPGEPLTMDDVTDDNVFIELVMAASNSLPLHGPHPDSLIAPVEPKSVLKWMHRWRSQTLAGGSPDKPESFELLNAARCLVYLHDGFHVGKIPAAEWAIEHGYPEAPLRRAIAVQRGEKRERALTPAGRDFVQSVIDLLGNAIAAS